jgi:hypothetical protein
VHDDGRPECAKASGKVRVREKNGSKRYFILPHHALGRIVEALGLEEEHKEFGDGWREFRKGSLLQCEAAEVMVPPLQLRIP